MSCVIGIGVVVLCPCRARLPVMLGFPVVPWPHPVLSVFAQTLPVTQEDATMHVTDVWLTCLCQLVKGLLAPWRKRVVALVQEPYTTCLHASTRRLCSRLDNQPRSLLHTRDTEERQNSLLAFIKQPCCPGACMSWQCCAWLCWPLLPHWHPLLACCFYALSYWWPWLRHACTLRCVAHGQLHGHRDRHGHQAGP